MIEVPTEIPVTKPAPDTVATPGADELQTPPAGVPVSADVVVPGKQMLVVPVMVGVVPTVRGRVAVQVPDVRMMFAVPLDTPVTTPLPDTVATPGADELHTADAGDPVSARVDGIHKVVGPDGVMDGSTASVPSATT